MSEIPILITKHLKVESNKGLIFLTTPSILNLSLSAWAQQITTTKLNIDLGAIKLNELVECTKKFMRSFSWS